jgi:hypothetical protein
MTTRHSDGPSPTIEPKIEPAIEPAVLRWLLDTDPSIRWQVLRDVQRAPAEVVARERARVAREGWGARLLATQRPDVNWGDGVSTPFWRSNLYTLLHLRALGADPLDAVTQRAIARVRDSVTWGEEFGDSPYFEGEVEPCINGGVLALGGYFGVPSDRLADRLLGEQLEDGGWNCEAERGSVRSSFHTTICVLEGLREFEEARGGDSTVAAARTRGEEYLLQRRLLRRLTTGERIEARKRGKPMPPWTQLIFPSMWQYDVLRALDHLRNAGASPDERMREAIDAVIEQRQPDGRWRLDGTPRDSFDEHMEGKVGEPSRWITLRALRVLDWHAAQR